MLNQKLKLLVVEDDLHFQKMITTLLSGIGYDNVCLSSGLNTGWSSFTANRPDICLLDIKLGEDKTAGIELGKRIREADKEVIIIFITSYFTEKNYALAREAKPSSFLSKELSRLTLYQAIELALYAKPNGAKDSKSEIRSRASVLPFLKNSKFFFKIGDTYKGVDVKSIDYFYSDLKTTYGRMEDRNFPTTVSLKMLEKGLSPNFLRCHKKYIVNVEQIKSINIKEDTVMIGNSELPIGYSYRKVFFNRLNLLK